MLGHQGGFVAADDLAKPTQMVFINWACPADGKANPVNGKRIPLSDAAKIVMRRTTRAHVILGVNLEPSRLGFAV